MPSSAVAQVAAALEAAGPDAELRTFAEPVPTAAAAAAVLGCQIGAIANSLVFVADGEPLLVLASGAHRVDTALLARRLGARRIRRASPDFVLEQAGQEVGGVAPVGHPSPLRTVIDADLAAFPVLWAGGGDHLTMFATSFEQLLELTKGTVLPVC
ncbi:MAG TPA: YbaK/EbsC family protein [Streptosporangiaceae bacterium]